MRWLLLLLPPPLLLLLALLLMRSQLVARSSECEHAGSCRCSRACACSSPPPPLGPTTSSYLNVLPVRLALELCGQQYQVCADACTGSISDC